jgi:hypothetical protein
MLILLVRYAIILHRRLVSPVTTLGSMEKQQGPGNDCTALSFPICVKIEVGEGWTQWWCTAVYVKPMEQL